MDKLKLGMVNIMPNAAAYADMVRAALRPVEDLCELHLIRLRTHSYSSSGAGGPPGHRHFDELTQHVKLDLLLVSGAPVEHLPFSEIRYWDELKGILLHAGRHAASVLGICFGGLAIAQHLGIGKQVLTDKMFGVHQAGIAPGPAAERYFGPGCASFPLALSSWALIDGRQLALPQHNSLQRIASHPEFGHLMLATEDGRFVMMFGHPEYTAGDLLREWERDLPKGVGYTRNFGREAFDAMAAQLGPAPGPILANWVRSHAEARLAGASGAAA